MKTHKKRLRPLVVLVAVMIVVSTVVAYWYMVWHRPYAIGSGPAGPAVPAAAFTGPWTTRPVHFVGLGDSITAGFGARPEHGYFARLRRNPADEYEDMQGKCLERVFPKLTVQNISLSGSTSLHAETHQLPRLDRQDSSTLGWVVITTGGNDIIHNYGRGPIREGAMYGATWEQARPWIANYEARLNRILDAINEKFPGGCHVFLANIYDPTDGVGDIENANIMLPAWEDAEPIHSAYNEVIARVSAARENVHLVDIYNVMLGHGIHCRDRGNDYYNADDPGYWYYSNLEDPNHRGYDAIRRAFLLEMVRVAQDTAGLNDGTF